MAIDPRMDVFKKTEILSRLEAAKFKLPPVPPRRRFILRTYPKIIPNKKFRWSVALIPSSVCFLVSIVSLFVILTQGFFSKSMILYSRNDSDSESIWLFLIAFSIFCVIFAVIWIPIYYSLCKRIIEKEIKQIKNSAGYKKQCVVLDKQYDELQKKADMEYLEKQKKYETEILPQYQRDLEEWTRTQTLKIEKAKKDLELARFNLANPTENKNTKK